MYFSMLSLLCTTVLFFKCFTSGVFGANPVVIVGGFGNSQLVAEIHKKQSVVNPFCFNQESKYTIWLDFPTTFSLVVQLSKLYGECWAANMKLVYDKKTHKTHDVPGVRIQTSEFGRCNGVEWLHSDTKLFKFLNNPPLSYILSVYQLFKKMCDGLERVGLKRDVSIRAAVYDFRKGPNESQEFFTKLKALIEETYNVNGKKPCVVIAYSMGATLTLNFLQQQSQQWKDKYIKAYVPLGGNFGGCMLPITMFCEGDNLGFPFISKEILREVLLTTPSMAYQCPRKKYWGDVDLVVTKSKRYSLNNIDEFFKDIPGVEDWETLSMMYKDVEPYKENSPPGVVTYCLCGNGVNTLEKIIYSGDKINTGFRKNVYGPGDGTVNLRSCQVCKEWAGKQKQKVVYKEYWKIKHLPLIKSDLVIKDICDIVSDRGDLILKG